MTSSILVLVKRKRVVHSVLVIFLLQYIKLVFFAIFIVLRVIR